MKTKKVAIYLTAFISLIFIINSASAYYPCDWSIYGGQLTNAPESQYYSGCKSTFTNQTGSINITSASFGDTSGVNYEPIVTGLDNFTNSKLIISNGNFIQVYDKNLVLLDDFNTGATTGQIAVGDFEGSGNKNNIAGIFRINASQLEFRTLRYNENNHTLDTISNLSFSMGSNSGSNGVRCTSSGDNSYCLTILYSKPATNYSNYLYKFYPKNSTYSIGQLLNETTSPILEPVTWADWDADGKDEAVIVSSDRIQIWQIDSPVQFERIFLPNFAGYFMGAKLMYPISTQTQTWLGHLLNPTANNGRLVVSEQCDFGLGCGSSPFIYNPACIQEYKSDGSLAWSNCVGGASVDRYGRIGGVAINDFNGDLKDDIWVYRTDKSAPFGTSYTYLQILKGDDGSVLHTSPDFSSRFVKSALAYSTIGFFGLKLAYLNPDNTIDAILTSPSGKILTYDTQTNSVIFNFNLSSGTTTSCIPADLNFDGLQDLICSTTGSTYAIYSNTTNDNAQMTSITFSPSTSIALGGSVDALINCYDNETDVIYYSGICDNGANSSAEDTNSVKSCTYSSLGTFNMTLRCRDYFHSGIFSQFSQNIIVTTAGVTCNYNNVCESGETNANCPSDCSVLSNQTQDLTGSAGGSLTIPSTLVDVNDETKGILPQIYYGTIALLSNSLQPIFIVVFVIFIALIILTIGTIIKKISHKVAGMK